MATNQARDDINDKIDKLEVLLQSKSPVQLPEVPYDISDVIKIHISELIDGVRGKLEHFANKLFSMSLVPREIQRRVLEANNTTTGASQLINGMYDTVRSYSPDGQLPLIKTMIAIFDLEEETKRVADKMSKWLVSRGINIVSSEKLKYTQYKQDTNKEGQQDQSLTLILLEEIRQQLKERDSEINEKEALIRKKDAQLKEKDLELKTIHAQLKEKENQLKDKSLHNQRFSLSSVIPAHPVDISCVKKIIERVLTDNHVALNCAFKLTLTDVADELFQARFITPSIKRSPSYDSIISTFKASLDFKQSIHDLEEYCHKFLEALFNVGGVVGEAAHMIKKEWIETIRNVLEMKLHM